MVKRLDFGRITGWETLAWLSNFGPSIESLMSKVSRLLILGMVVELVSTLELSDEEDSLIWQFSSKGVYSSQSLYKIVNFRGINYVHVSAVWSLKVPPSSYVSLVINPIIGL